jgi:hypothetical protein
MYPLFDRNNRASLTARADAHSKNFTNRERESIAIDRKSRLRKFILCLEENKSSKIM